ncbi:MAG: HNH endonuclease [Myxococcota bacterium]|nr:HNH endonuclease [Myxococcota bacterium]
MHRVVIHLAPHLLSDGLVANLDDGTWIAPETWRRVACDCALDVVKVDEVGAVLDVGRRTRTIPPALTRALDVRDAGRCRFPGCMHRRFLDRHHVKHWSNDGETKLDNLLTLCTAHHQLVHEGGWSVEIDGEAAWFFRPDGTQLVWPRPPRVDDTVADLEAAHAEMKIGPTTGLTQWNGQTPEYARCVQVALGD